MPGPAAHTRGFRQPERSSTYFDTHLMVRLLSLGQLSLVGNDGQPVSNAAAQPRRLALLAVLGRSAPKAVSREKLIAWFWPDADEERGRRSLNQALYALRSELGSEDVLLGQRDLRLNLDLVGLRCGGLRDGHGIGSVRGSRVTLSRAVPRRLPSHLRARIRAVDRGRAPRHGAPLRRGAGDAGHGRWSGRAITPAR